MKPRVRVKAPSFMLGWGVPIDARAGDLVIGNRGAAAVVTKNDRLRSLHLVIVADARLHQGGKIHDFSGGTRP